MEKTLLIVSVIFSVLSLGISIYLMLKSKKNKATKPVDHIEGAVKIKKLNGSVYLTDAVGNKILEI